MSSRNSDTEDTGSQHSGTSGTTGGGSETSSQRSASRFLRRERAGAEREEGDLLEQKRSLQDGIFSCMYTLVRQSAMSNWKFAVLKCVLEGLMGLIVVFNPSIEAWEINTSNPVWQIVRWTVWRSPIARIFGYNTYLVVMYVMATAVFLAVVGLVMLTLAMRRQEQSKWLRIAAMVLHIVYDVMFTMFYVSFLDYFCFAANCHYSSDVINHVHFEGVMCLEMPHLLHMCIALVTAIIFFCVTALFVVASSDLNPVSLGYLASPAAVSRLKILAAKAAFVISASDLQSWPKPQAVLIVLTVTLICWWNFQRLPFYRVPVNVIWCSMWFGVLFVAGVLIFLVFSGNTSPEFARDMTMLVLYGIFPAIAFGVGVCGIHVWWASRPAKLFLNLQPGVRIQKVYKFKSSQEVEVLSRVMRKFGVDNIVDEEAAAWGETIIKAGMQSFPNTPFLLILYANFLLEVRKDGPASRTQLQLAFRHSPSLIERYQIFCTGESSKRLKDSQDGGMDLQAYIEFRRNFRAVLRVHKEVLLLQNDLWALMTRSNLRVTEVDRTLDALEASTAVAHQVYKRVLERYPTNGKLLRCYGKFLEDVRHDPLAAARAYGEASRNGGGDAILSLDLSKVQGAADKPEFLSSMSIEDDAVIVINSKGQVMMVSQAVQTVFGYPKVELEGANVSVLMPQPFCQRHDGYLERHINGGEPHILDTVREVIALHKERYVFPMSLCVTRMSGVGEDSIFLGVARPLPLNSLNVRAWLAPNGVIMCGDQQFASLCGVLEGELVGRPLSSMLAEPDTVVTALLERCREASATELMAGTIQVQLLLKHRYMDPVPIAVTVGLAGTDGQRILVLNCAVWDHDERSILVVDSHMRVRFASCGLAASLGYPVRKLMAMRLEQLLPPPFNALHARYLRDQPAEVLPTSCRAGKVVHLLHESGSSVPVRLKISNATGADVGLNLHVVQVSKVPADELLEEKRLVVTADFSGRVLSVSQPESDLFGFRAQDMVGGNLADSIDIFQEWCDRAGQSQMQLFMLALLDKEHEMPGTSWRVRVHPPGSNAGSSPHAGPGAKPLPGIASRAAAASKSACLQVELHEGSIAGEAGSGPDVSGGVDDPAASSPGEGEVDNHIRVTLWRRDLLTGVVELDEELVVRKASPMTGLITGMPATAMLKKPIQRFLDIPPDTTWEKLAEAHSHRKQRGGLKDDSKRGKISPPMAFIGPHPDTGTMRIIIQGVQVMAPGGRSKVTITMHPDTTFAGAHADLMRVLHLDAALAADAGPSGGDTRAGTAAATQHPENPPLDRGSNHAEKPGLDQSACGRGGREPAGGAAGEQAPGSRLGSDVEPEGREASEESDSDSSDGEAAKTPRKKPREEGKGAERDLEAEGQARILGKAASKSDFVAQWVRTLTKRQSGDQRGSQRERPADRPGSSGSGGGGAGGFGAAGEALGQAQPLLALPAPPGSPPKTAGRGGVQPKGSGLRAIPEDEAPLSREEEATLAHQKTSKTMGRGASYDFGDQKSTVGGSRQISRNLATPPTGGPLASGVGPHGAGIIGAGPASEAGGLDASGGMAAAGEKWEKGSEGESSADGSQATSGISNSTGATSLSELVIDSRRGRLLKSLQKLLLGPLLMRPLERLRLHTYGLLTLMVVCHVICYIVISSEIAAEDHDIFLVHRQALAMDRSQLITVRAMMGAFCERANVTAKVSVCANSMNYTLGKLKENIDLMESHHQFVYLGEDKSKAVPLMPEVFSIWTRAHIEYHTYLDTSPPQINSAVAGVWQLGSRYVAAAREAQYWLPVLRDRYRLHRTFNFLVTNGLGPLFTGYAQSLDLLVDAAWKSVDKLRITVIVLLVVEALVIQLSCLVYEGYLVQKLEAARVVGILAMLGLPAPVLRQLANKDVKVLGDGGDDEENDEESDAEEEQQHKVTTGRGDDVEGGNRITSGAGESAAVVGVGGAGSPKGGQHPDSAEGARGERPRGVKLLAVDDGDGDEKPKALMAAPVDASAGKGATTGRPGSGGRTTFALGPSAEAKAAGRDVAPGEMNEDADDDDGTAGDELRRCRTEARLPRKMADQGAAQPSSKRADRKPGISGSRVQGLHVNGKVLIPSFSSLTKFMVPFALWNIAMVVIYVVSLVELQGMQGPLASLNMASHIIYRYTRVRAIAFGFVSQDDIASRELWRDMLANELRLFESEYDALMYGGVPITQANAVFNHPVPASTFASSSFADSFFRSKRCYRYEQDTCFKPGDEYYEVTHNGLDVMVRRMLAEMRLLSQDVDEDVAYNGSRYMYMYNVGGQDLYEGLQQAAQLFVDYSIDHYHEVSTMHTILLIATLCLIILYVVFILWPHLARLKNDAARQSALLSHVPPEVDVRSHVRAVAKRALYGNQKRTGKSGALVSSVGGALTADRPAVGSAAVA